MANRTKKEIERLSKLGVRIRKVRSSQGYSQDRLCLEGELSRGTMSKIESGAMNPSYLTLMKIADTIGVSIKKLVDVS